MNQLIFQVKYSAMPELHVSVNEESVTVVDVHEEDDLSAVACELVKMKYDVNPAFPTIMVDGKTVDEWKKVNFRLKYKFGKLTAHHFVSIIMSIIIVN